MREMAVGHDANFSEVALVGRNNSDLADDLGNLLSRTVKFLLKSMGGAVPFPSGKEPVDDEVISMAVNRTVEIERLIKSLKVHTAIEEMMQFIRRLNKYMDESAPFKILNTNPERAGTVIYNLLEGLRFAAVFLWPVFPAKSEQILNDIGAGKQVVKFEDMKWGQLVPGTKVSFSGTLFPRYDAESLTRDLSQIKETPVEQEIREIDINDFAKLDLRSAVILEAQPMAGSEKIIRLTVDTGTEKRTLAAGIAKHYKPEDLVGRKIIIVRNLKPKKIFGIESHGMILAATHEGKLSLLTLDQDLPPGSKVS
jgi:methionyl-tRNA synthetase